MATNLIFKESTNQQQNLSHYKVLEMVVKSKIATKLNLNPSALCILMGLCSHLNISRNDSFPHQDLLALELNLSLSSVKRGIKELLTKGLIIKTKKHKSSVNLYKFTQKFFELINLKHRADQIDLNHEVNLTCPYIEHKKHNMRKTSSCKKIKIDKQKQTKNDDVLKNFQEKKIDPIKNKKFTEYKQILKKLKNWQFSGAEFVIKKNGLEKINKLIKIVEEKNPSNPGAYLRTLLKLPNQIIPTKTNSSPQNIKDSPIKKMLKHQYWCHVPSNKIYQIKPDVGTHSLIKFKSPEKLITFIENDFTDKLENFKPSSREEYLVQNKEQLDNKPTREQIIKDMVEKGEIEGVKTLSEMWKIRIKFK